MDIRKFKNLLSGVKDDFHVSFEFMLAMIEGKLDAQDRQSIESHLNHCSICKSTYQAIQKEIGLLSEGQSVLKEERKSIDLRLMKKLRLVAEIYPQKDFLAEKIAQIFLPKVSWLSIKPVITVFREWLKGDGPVDQSGETDGYAIAAFAGGALEDNEDNEIIVNAVKTADYICESIIEQCQEMAQIGTLIDSVIEQAFLLFPDDLNTSDNRSQVREAVRSILSV